MKWMIFICAAFGLAACGQQADIATHSANSPAVPTVPNVMTLEDIDFASYSEDLAKFVGLKNSENSWAAIDKMRLYFAPEDGTTILQTKTSTFDRPDGSVMIYTVSGIQDDSIKSQELFMIFTGEKDAQILAAHGMKQKCHRGKNTTDWTTELCP